MSRVRPPRPCEGRNALIVEDEAIVALLVEDMLTELGCAQIWTAANLADATAVAAKRKPDIVILDVNLAGTPSFPLAEKLAELDIPFVFTTGYAADGLPAKWAGQPVIQKPFAAEALGQAIVGLLG